MLKVETTLHLRISLSYRNVIVASVSLTALCTFPVLVPDVVAERHVTIDLPDALSLS